MATITAVGAGGAWNSTATWDTAAVPTAADDVVLNATSGNVTISAAAVARSLNCTGYTATLTHNASVTLSLGDATAAAGNAVLTLSAGMTYTLGSAIGTAAIAFVSTSATQQTLTFAGKVCGNLTFSGVGASWLLADTVAGAWNFVINAGTVNTGSQTVNCGAFWISGATAVGTLGTSTFNLSGTATNLNLFLRSSGGTYTMGAGTFNITAATSNARQWASQATATSSATLNYIVSGSPGQLLVFPPFDMANVNFYDASNARTLAFVSGSTYTVRNNFNVQGAPGQLMSVVSNTAGSIATLSKPSRVVSCDYLAIKDITAAGGASWYAGANSVDNGNNAGWLWTPPSNYQFLQLAAPV